MALIAIVIVTGTIFYSRFLSQKIAREERLKVEQWVEAGKLLLKDSTGLSDRLVSIIITENKSIPIIETDEQDRIIQSVNLDSARVSDSAYLQNKLKEFSTDNDPITWTDPLDSSHINRYYYGHTSLLHQVQYYPLIQLFIVALFIIITFIALTSSYKSVQNQVWAGMAKETAHQLGTPLSSLEGWVEMLKEHEQSEAIVVEMQKDVERLKLVSDRFGKIGSSPQLGLHNVVDQVRNMMDYVRKRAAGRVSFSLDTQGKEEIMAHISPPLFDWVIENLLKNALDAMEGKGQISIIMEEKEKELIIDVKDTGKGIARQQQEAIFKPGFTTKKRGWGLGLSLSRRIIQQYHSGQIFVRQSELGKGTTFRIVLKK